VTNDRPRRYHYAFALKRVKRGYKVSHVLDYASRGRADKASLRLLAEHGDAARSRWSRSSSTARCWTAMRKPRGEFQFEATTDLAAIGQAKAAYADQIARYDYALLSDARGRFVWEQGIASHADRRDPNRARGGGSEP
jgi:hypothetical protein